MFSLGAVQVPDAAFTGPIAPGLSLVAIVVSGLVFAFGESGSSRAEFPKGVLLRSGRRGPQLRHLTVGKLQKSSHLDHKHLFNQVMAVPFFESVIAKCRVPWLRLRLLKLAV